MHSKDSKNYPDNNHKPEMTIALTPFEALCSFKPLPQILEHIRGLTIHHNDIFIQILTSNTKFIVFASTEVEELKMLVTKTFESIENINVELKNEQHLKNFFTNLMNSDPQTVANLANKLYQRIQNNGLAL